MSTDGPVAIVTGASGFIGRALIERLVAEGTQVTAISRNVTACFPAGVTVRTADLATGEGVSPELFDGADEVFHCAGELRHQPAMRSLHVEGTARLLDALCARRSGSPMHWVQLSSVGAYGPPGRAWEPRRVDETTPETPLGEYEITKTESDRLVRAAAADGGFTFSILRPSGVVGLSMSNSSLRGLIGAVRRGLFFHVGPEGSIANYVHVDDVVEGLLACARDPRAAGEIFNLSSDCGWTDLVDEIAGYAGVSPPRLRVARPLARTLAYAGRYLGIPLTVSRVDALIGRTRYPSDKIERTLGFRFVKPMPAAVRDVMGRG